MVKGGCNVREDSNDNEGEEDDEEDDNGEGDTGEVGVIVDVDADVNAEVGRGSGWWMDARILALGVGALPAELVGSVNAMLLYPNSGGSDGDDNDDKEERAVEDKEGVEDGGRLMSRYGWPAMSSSR